MDVYDGQADLALLLQRSDGFPVYEDYKALDRNTRSIRLPKIWHETDGEIHTAIMHASLDKNIEYEALSYCWGPPDIQKKIYIGQAVLLIRSSLHGFLDALCHNNQPLPVWVDSICINQGDVHERNWQVSMMGDIYRHAARVKSWIGPPDSYTRYAFAYMNHHHDEKFLSSENLATARRLALESFQTILDHTYWKRLWVVQETALARELFIVCGNMTTTWEVFLDAYEHDFAPSRHILSALSDLKKGSGEAKAPSNDPLARYAGYRSIKDLASKSLLLVQMSRFANQACEDPRDRIFGLLSIAQDGEQITVDYAKAFADILVEVILITYRHTLKVRRIRLLTKYENIYFRQQLDDIEGQVYWSWLLDFVSNVRDCLHPTNIFAHFHDLLDPLLTIEVCLRTRHRLCTKHSRLDPLTHPLDRLMAIFDKQDETLLDDNQ